MRPILKWAGGKTQMLKDILPRIPEYSGKFIEPFVGGGALYFSLLPENAVIADSNPELINVYVQVANVVDEVITILKGYENTEEMFYSVRALDYETLSPVEAAARTIYLNKTCFNGLYRVNRKGQFNTPFGHYKNPPFATRICYAKFLRYYGKQRSSAGIIWKSLKSMLCRVISFFLILLIFRSRNTPILSGTQRNSFMWMIIKLWQRK